MNNKKIVMYVSILILILIVLGAGFLINKNKNQEYIPQEEITDEQLRQTIITLYFFNIETGNIMPEARKIDAKELIKEPYKVLIELLINGPKSEKLVKLIPDGTKLNKIEIKNDCIYIDFSNEFINGQKLGKEQEELIIKSIVNTVTELKEINSVKILIDGKENQEFRIKKLILKNHSKDNYFKNLYILIDFTALSRLHKKYSTSFIE